MRPGTPGFVGERLKEAREARGLTQISLGEMLGVSNRAISQYERRKGSPHPEIMKKIPEILNMPYEFFFMEINEEVENKQIFYRSMSSTTAAARIRGNRRYEWLKRITDFIEEFVELPDVNFPQYILPQDPLKISLEDIEAIADNLRKYWGLGEGPISNVVYLLENNGTIVSRMNLYANQLDAFSDWREANNRPYVILGSDKGSCARSRLDAAHELGHLVLHNGIGKVNLKNTPTFKLLEQQAFKFAGAFLLPATSFADDFMAPTLDVLLALKGKWKVSIGAMLMRAQDLDLLDSEQVSRLWRTYARRGYKKKEPLDDELIPEKPELLKQAIKFIIEENKRTKTQLLSELCLPRADIEEIAGLPSGYLDNKPKIKSLSKIIPFPKRDIF